MESRRLGCVCFAERRLQKDAFGVQVGLRIEQPIVAIPQHYTARAGRHERHGFSIVFLSWGQEDAGRRTRPTQLRRQPNAIKRLPVRMIFAIASEASSAHTPGHAGKAADGQRHAVYDGHGPIIADQLIAQPTPQPLFDRPQVGRLPHEGRASGLPQSGKVMTVVRRK